STRMKAGTTQKLALNMISTAVMIRLGKVYGNAMVEITAINEKMVVRCEQMLIELTGCDAQTAASMLKACEYHVKTAAAAILLDCDAEGAKRRLNACGGQLAALIKGE
ncbi:MAG: N-acetylmuramic acid 6-phosphate etherase, partial [Clostridia bacterium]|nr:N-acetylmuramic acid 6-phosphate etherase [Clostridia bacterium]